MEVIILAGGLGTRLRSAVPNLPKPMAPIGDSPFLSYLLAYWTLQGATHFIVGTGYKAHCIEEYFGREYEGIPITYARESSPLGTGGGMCFAAKLLQTNNPFLVLNADTFVQLSLSQMQACLQKTNAAVVMGATYAKEKGRYAALECTEAQKLQRVVDSTQEQCLINAGVYLFSSQAPLTMLERHHPQAFSLEKAGFYTWLNEASTPVYVCPTTGYFIDIGVPQDYQRAQTVLPSFIKIPELNS